MKELICLGVVLIVIIIVWPGGGLAEEAIYANDYYLSFFPNYPPAAGQKVNLRLKTFRPVTKVTLYPDYSDLGDEIYLTFKGGYWWGEFQIPTDYKAGSHFFTVWLHAPFTTPPQPNIFGSALIEMGLKKQPLNRYWAKSVVWYKTAALNAKPTEASPLLAEVSFEAAETEEVYRPVTGEALVARLPSVEASPFIIKGAKTLTFSSKTIVGTKEGFTPGLTREEGLRLNIAGQTDGTEIDANLISTSTTGTTQIAQRQDKISVLMRRASTEVYLGDFTAELSETEFAKLNQVLSGIRVRGDYGRFNFYSFYSTPQGEPKFYRAYGNGTQGPYQLAAAPAVINSERVAVDGLMQKRGDDYTIDYEAGTITFIKKTIDPKSIINVNYDYRQSVYAHSTYGLRLTTLALPNLKLGATYLNDSDSLAGAAEIRQTMSREAINPAGHYVIGVDGALVSELLTANGEIAYSNNNKNLLSTGSEESGKAVRLEISSQLGPLGLKAFGKRVGALFRPLADPDPKQDVTNYGGILSLRTGPLFGLQGSYARDKYTQSGTIYNNSYHSAKALLTPDNLPSLEYYYAKDNQSNDPVTGAGIGRSITRHSAESSYRLGFLTSTLKATKEQWLNKAPSEEATDYERVNLGLATVGLEKTTLTCNAELERRREPAGDRAAKKSLILNLSATPSKLYFLSGTLDYIDDSQTGARNSVNVSYRAEIDPGLRLEGKYNIQSLNEDFVTVEGVAKHSGSFSFDLRPFSYLRLRYLFQPNFTKIARTNSLSFNNEQQQTEVNLIPLPEMLLGLLTKVGHGFNINRRAAPDYQVKDNTADTNSTLYTLKLAPFKIFSTEFNYLLENGVTTQLTTLEPATYIGGQSLNRKLDAIVKTSLSERFAIDSRYTYQRSTAGSAESTDNSGNTVSHTAALKGNWNISDAWSVSISGGFTKTTNFLSAKPVTYTASPGFGFIFRQRDRLRLDFDWSYSKSYSGAETEVTNYSLRGKYSLSDYVSLTLRGQQEISRAPDYRLTDITGNIEINL